MATALRPIENALPIAQERPRKQAKVSVPIRKQSEPLVNDENQASVPENPEATIEYVPSESLEPIQDPESKIQSLIEGLDLKDWIKLCGSLNDARRFTIHHSDLLVPFIEKVLLVLVKAMKNPRSALCKTSIMASSDIFNKFGDKLFESSTSESFDHLLLQLLLKACQDKKFVCEEADRALSSMVASFEPLSLLQRLKAYVKHFNLRVRAKAMVSISNCISKMSLEGMKSYGLASLVEMAADLVNDKLPEARVASRSALVSVCRAFKESPEIDEHAWQHFCHSNLSTVRAQCVLKFTSTA